jgi:putative SOS response-associated peptidase YedK
MVQRFIKKDDQPGEKNRQSHWFDVPAGHALRCLVIGEGEQQRVYIVTTDAPAELDWIHDRWPLIGRL